MSDELKRIALPPQISRDAFKCPKPAWSLANQSKPLILRKAIAVLTLWLVYASGAQAQLTAQDQRNMPWFVHGYAGVEFPLPLPNLVCGMGAPAQVWNNVQVVFGKNARCGARQDPSDIELFIPKETYNEEDLFTYREIAERRCGGPYSISVELAEAPPIAGMIAFKCRTHNRNEQGREWVVEAYLLLDVSSTQWIDGFPPQPNSIWKFEMSGPPNQIARVREYLATVIAGMRRGP